MFPTIAWGVIAGLLIGWQWPEFRGANGGREGPGLGTAAHLERDVQHRWKTAVHGRAWSSPVVLDGQIWVTTATEDGKQLFAVALDQESGRVLHDLKVFDVATPQYAHPFNTYASPTPAIERGRVYVTFGSPGTAALDTASGKVLWERRDLECNHYRGAGLPPVIFRDLLLLHYDGSDVQYGVALDKRTGKTVWKTKRSIDFKDLGPDGKPQAEGDLRKAFSTPQVIEVDGAPLLVSMGAKATYAYDPLTGKERWRVEERTNHSASTRPVAGFGLVFLPTGFPKGELLAVRPDGRGDITATHVAWRLTRGVPNKPSGPAGRRPALHDDRRRRGKCRRGTDRPGGVDRPHRRHALGLAGLCRWPRLLLQRRGQDHRRRGRSHVQGAGRKPAGRRVHGLAGHRRQGVHPAIADAPLSGGVISGPGTRHARAPSLVGKDCQPCRSAYATMAYPTIRLSLDVVAVLMCAAAVSLSARPDPRQSAPVEHARPAGEGTTDLDAFMAQVLAKRDENWRKLQQYVLDERERAELVGPAGARLYGLERDRRGTSVTASSCAAPCASTAWP